MTIDIPKRKIIRLEATVALCYAESFVVGNESWSKETYISLLWKKYFHFFLASKPKNLLLTELFHLEIMDGFYIEHDIIRHKTDEWDPNIKDG